MLKKSLSEGHSCKVEDDFKEIPLSFQIEKDSENPLDTYNLASSNDNDKDFDDLNNDGEKNISIDPFRASKSITEASSIHRPEKLIFKRSLKKIQLGLPYKFKVERESSNIELGKDLRAELKQILRNKELCILFRNWLKTQYCEENLSFWVDIELYRKDKECKNMKERAQEIYDKYLKVDAQYSLNIDDELRRDILKKLKNTTEDSVDSSLFDTVQQYVFSLLETGCISRFLNSKQYLDWQDKMLLVSQGTEGAEKRNEKLTARLYKSLRLNAKKESITFSQERLNLEKLFYLIDAEQQNSKGHPQ